MENKSNLNWKDKIKVLNISLNITKSPWLAKNMFDQEQIHSTKLWELWTASILRKKNNKNFLVEICDEIIFVRPYKFMLQPR